MDKKTIYIVVAVIVVILIVGVAGVMLLNNNGNGGTTNPTATPTPSVPVANATDLSFSVNQTTSGVVVSYTYTCKGLNAVDEKVRVDMCLTEGTYSYIIDLGTQKSYASTNGGSTWTATTFADDCTNYVTPFHNIVTKIVANGNANDFSFTENGSTNDVFCIAVNPTIADSVFATS